MDVAYEANGVLFTWDEAKAEANQKKHGVIFFEATQVFFYPLYEVEDAGRDGEQRYGIKGYSQEGRLLLVVARKMTARTRPGGSFPPAN